MNKKRIFLFTIMFLLIATNVFAYPSLKDDCAYIGKCNYYWAEIDTSQEYYYDNADGYPTIDVVIDFSLTDEGRAAIFKNISGPYKDEAQWLVKHIRYDFYSNYGESQVLSYKILDANRNVIYEKTEPGELRSWGNNWVAYNVVSFINNQFENGAYTNSDGKVCYK